MKPQGIYDEISGYITRKRRVLVYEVEGYYYAALHPAEVWGKTAAGWRRDGSRVVGNRREGEMETATRRRQNGRKVEEGRQQGSGSSGRG